MLLSNQFDAQPVGPIIKDMSFDALYEQNQAEIIARKSTVRSNKPSLKRRCIFEGFYIFGIDKTSLKVSGKKKIQLDEHLIPKSLY